MNAGDEFLKVLFTFFGLPPLLGSMFSWFHLAHLRSSLLDVLLEKNDD